jgi:hypothetical protein
MLHSPALRLLPPRSNQRGITVIDYTLLIAPLSVAAVAGVEQSRADDSECPGRHHEPLN